MIDQVIFSETETRLFGLKMGRYNTTNINDDLVKEAIAKEKYDVVRVKTNCKDEFASLKLNQTNLPVFFNGGVRRYRVNCFEAPLPGFTQPDINFELYIGQKKDILNTIMTESWGDYPLCYYRTPGLEHLITKEMEMQSLFEFYARFNDHTQYENSYLWFVKTGNIYVGFIALYVYRDQAMVDSTIAGFLKAYQSKGLFPNILRHIRGFCREEGITYFCCGARNENMYSQRAFEKDYMTCTDVEYIYHIVPLLSKYPEKTILANSYS